MLFYGDLLQQLWDLFFFFLNDIISALLNNLGAVRVRWELHRHSAVPGHLWGLIPESPLTLGCIWGAP